MTIDFNLELRIETRYIEPHCGGTDEYGNEETLGGYYIVEGIYHNDKEISGILTQEQLNEIEHIIN